MAGIVARELKRTRPFTSHEQEVFLGLQVAGARIVEPLAKFLKTTAGLTLNQYNVLRILRGSHPARLQCGDIAERMIARDPDITRLVDRLTRRGLVARVRSRQDRRVVEVTISEKGRDILQSLDEQVDRMPKDLLGHLGPNRLKELGSLLDHVIAELGASP